MEVRAEPGHALLRLDENVTFENAAGFKVALERALGQGPHDFVVDFGTVNYLCSSAVGSLIYAVRKFREAGGRVVAVVSHAKLRHLFQLVHLNEMVTFAEDYEGAREQLDGAPPPVRA